MEILNAMEPEKINHPYLTAIKRTDLSVPTRYLLQHNLLKGRILDFGCGSGRDTRAFLDLGYSVEATDGSEELCVRASEYTGIPVKKLFFQDLDAKEQYDGIWACASILHLPKQELYDVFRKMIRALKENGILYTSFKYGTFEGYRKERYFTDFTEQTLTEFLKPIKELKQ